MSTTQRNNDHFGANTVEDDEEDYRQKVARDREIAQSKKRKTISAEQAELARTTGLSGQVVALMAGHDDGSEEDATNSDDDRSKSDSDGGNRKRKKKSKRKHKKKDSKKNSSKRKKKRRRDYESESEGSYSSKEYETREKISRDASTTKGRDDSSISNECRSKNHDKKHSSDSDSDSTRSCGGDRKSSKKRNKNKSRSSSKRSRRRR
ncbi:hypothetical protein ACHAXS_011177 [Conticribra weissflogii]